MSFDRLAPHYRWMEWVLAGARLQRCRVSFLSEIPAPERVLLLGEGNGRCLVELVRAFPAARFTCVDASVRMLQCARVRLRRKGVSLERIDFVHTDIQEWRVPEAEFDLIVTHFFLDCFSSCQLTKIIPLIAAAARPGARWLLADFREPESGLARWRARWIFRMMYWFFQHVTQLPASRLTAPDHYLRLAGFSLHERRIREWGLLHSDLWVAG